MFLNSYRRVGAAASRLAISCSSFSTIRLNKRMSELDICSRREADRWMLGGRVRVNGKVATVGEKVEESLPATAIEIAFDGGSGSFSPVDSPSNEELTTAVVLNKPAGYVSGQAEHGYTPAAKLLTRDRLWDVTSGDIMLPNNSWSGFAPAGRLDLDSTGLLVFAHSGVISKKLIHHNSSIEKVYNVKVVQAVQETRRELQIDQAFRLPETGSDISVLTKGGGRLLGDARPLKPCRAEWLEEGTSLRMVLNEGRKQHIRRSCRELLGYHVTSLERIRIGPIETGDLPEGCWRPLTLTEIKKILNS